jgi:hypothetical protein
VYAVNGKEYIAVTVGGTVTSSSGGTVASQLQVFALGGSQTESPAFTIAYHPKPAPAHRVLAASTRPVSPVHVTKGAAGRIATPQGLTIKAWDPNSSNTQSIQAKVVLAGKPVAGVAVSVNGWVAPVTDKNGMFTYPIDNTMPDRRVAKVVSVKGATIDGKPLTAAQAGAVLAAKGGISMGYALTDLAAKPGSNGTVVVTGRLTFGQNQAPIPVGLYSYLLKGRVTYADGRPAAGAVVTTRTNDHKFWTYSTPAGPDGRYAAFLVAADQEGSDPVPMTVGVAVGQDAYAEPLNDFINFAELKSASLDIQLPAAAGAPLPKASLNPQTIPGAIYEGLLVGVYGHGRAIAPVSATWPDANGRFQLVLPKSARGLVVRFWEADRQWFTTSTPKPGGPVDLSVYPKAIPTEAPQGIATLKLPG